MKTKRGSAFRLATAGLLTALVLVLSGDRGVYTAAPSGIDPLEVLNLTVRANAIIVLDSSGSMREITNATGLVTGIGNGELVGDDPGAKMAQSKQVLRQIVQDNQDKISFQFGRYTQALTDTNATGVHLTNRFYYATTDANAAGLEINPTGNGASTPGVKRRATGTAAQVDNRTIDGVTHYYLIAGRFWNGQVIDTVTRTVTGAAVSPTNPASVILTNGTVTVRFQYRGVNWIRGNTSTACDGFESLQPLADCTDNLQIDTIGPHLDPEVAFNADGSIAGYVDGPLGTFNAPFTQPTLTPAVRPVGGTPIRNSLRDIRQDHWGPLWSGSISSMTPKPSTFVIFVTDGDDQCLSGTFDENARAAAYQAELLYRRIVATEPASSVTTFFVAFGASTGIARSNWIAWGGSGMTGIPNDGTRWTREPTPAERAACTTCRDAFIASNADALSAALQTALDQGQSVGEFSDQQSITESIFEYAGVFGEDPEDPNRRYEVTLPVLLQSTFEMPGFEGHLKAFRNDAETSLQVWDAADELLDRLSPTWTGTAVFTQLHGGATPDTIGASTAFIKRRIYTTIRNGVFVTGTDSTIVNNLTTPRYQPAGQVAIWPPAATVDPTGTSYPAGVLDVALGIMGSPTAGDVNNFNALVAEYAACTSAVATDRPTDCGSTAGNPDLRLRLARREARQIILAHAAGAELVKSGGLALRTVCSGCGQLQFQKRASLLAESTLAAPAVVTPPLQGNPETHVAEYKLYRDGPRATGDIAANGIANGFGLRNPDVDANTPATGPDTRTTLKPVMSVVYHGANDMLHAFRAGPCQSLGSAGSCTGGASETGGEELWAYVPYDQLGKLRERLKPQARDPHTYVIAAPVRVSDIFVPGSFSRTVGGVSVSGGGVWRTIILFGRGIGGKHLSALDVTAPGPFTASSLSTAPPIALWNRGNPDTQDGTLGGTRNNNTGDYNAYLGMGQTWSVPAIGFVTAADNVTVRKSAGVEFVAYVGSGYGTGTNAVNEGTHFYTLDVLTGDVVAAVDVGDRAGMGYENALVASPAAFNLKQVDLRFVRTISNPAGSKTTRVYIGDIHGRVWRVMSDAPGAPPLLFADLGADQPVANPVALVSYDGTQTDFRPHVFVEAGNDNRIAPPPDPTPPFRLYGLRDDDLSSDPDGSDSVGGVATVLFTMDLPDGFRGNVQPATAFTDTTPPAARVFFAATRFNLPNTPNAPAPPPCRSSFDSIIVALGAESGNAAYDLNASGDDRFAEIVGQRVQAVRVAGGRLVADMGLGAQTPPPPPAPPVVQPPAPSPLANVMMGAYNPDGTPRIVGLIPFKTGSAVCR
ncbi:MAG TPA: hypothetical protein VMT87_15245 [Vicinamibacteria bacterium]|nr:hypothetical protein [Vicinamibacteria bacterium]